MSRYANCAPFLLWKFKWTQEVPAHWNWRSPQTEFVLIFFMFPTVSHLTKQRTRYLLIISPASAKLFSPAVIADEGIIWSGTSWSILLVPSLFKPKLAVFLSSPCLRPSFLSVIVPMMYVKGWWSDQVWVQSLFWRWVLNSHQREKLSKPHVRLSLLPWIS